jgi:lipoate-protein ligase A
MSERTVRLISESAVRPAGVETGISHATLIGVGRGRLPETLRLHPTADILAFGRQDAVSPGYASAMAAATAAGFTPVERLAGGRAAVFHADTLAFAWAMPNPEPRDGIHERFALLAGIVATALRSLGADARVGEVPGEYCPGAYSVSLGGRVKVMGVGQRLVRGAAHLGGVIVVGGGDRVRGVLEPVYAALGLSWDPATAGDLASVLPGVGLGEVAQALAAELGRRFRVEEGEVDALTLTEGGELAAAHLPAGVSPPPGW